MIDNTKQKFLTTDLDTNLLSTPFRIQTNWHVITGASCSGKTTLLDQLSDRGFLTAAESAREYFDREIARGRTVEEIRENGPALQCAIDDLQRRLEHGFRANEVIFLDRALPDSLSFYRVAGLNPNDILA